LKNQRKYLLRFFIAVILGLVLLGAMSWGNYRFVKQNPGGNDFLVHWMGTKSLVLQGLNPYSDEVALKIQEMAYGRPAEPGEHELRVAYPLYSVALFLPFSLIPSFAVARALWMTLLEVGLVLLVILSLQLARWRVNPIMLVVLLLFGILWYHGLRPLINGNAVILVAVGLAGGFLAIRNGADELAGVLFAFTTIKPQVVVVVLAFVAIWAISQRRTRIFGWMFGTVVLMAASAALLIPTWPLDMLREVIRYPSYNPPGSPEAAFRIWWPAWGARVGWALTGITVLILLVEWWNNRHADFNGFLWTACLTLTVSQWTGIQTDPGNFIVLFPALVLVFSLLSDRWKTGGRLFVGFSLIVLLVGIWVLFYQTLSIVHGQPVQSSLMFYPLPAYLLVTLYWVRWWAVEPPTVWYDMLEGR
jgi:hypothetical protein